MTLNGDITVTLHYFTEFGKHTLQHITAASIFGRIYARVYCILQCVRCRRKESSRSLSRLLMLFLYTKPLTSNHRLAAVYTKQVKATCVRYCSK